MDVDKIKDDMADFAMELRKIEASYGRMTYILKQIPKDALDIRAFLVSELYDMYQESFDKVSVVRRALLLEALEREKKSE